MDELLLSLDLARSAVERALIGTVLQTPRVAALLASRRAITVDGRTLDADTAVLLALDDFQRGSDLTRSSPVEARRRFARQIAVVDAPPPHGLGIQDRLIPGPAGSIPVRVYTPPGVESPSPAIVFFHGGGWVIGSIATHDGLCRRIALGARARVISVDYRLAPEHPFPAAVDDALAAYRWVAEHAASLGVDPARIAVAGDSAGGNLSAVVARRARDDARAPALQVLIYPGADATGGHPSRAVFARGYILTGAMIDWFFNHYAGENDRLHPDLSPFHADDLRGVAPALVYTAGFDPLRDEGRAYADRLRDAGVRVTYDELPGMIHGYTMMTRAIPAAARAVAEMALDIGRALRA